MGFLRFSIGFLRFMVGFLRFSIGFLRFMVGFLRFSIGFLRFMVGFLRFSMLHEIFASIIFPRRGLGLAEARPAARPGRRQRLGPGTELGALGEIAAAF